MTSGEAAVKRSKWSQNLSSATTEETISLNDFASHAMILHLRIITWNVIILHYISQYCHAMYFLFISNERFLVTDFKYLSNSSIVTLLHSSYLYNPISTFCWRQKKYSNLLPLSFWAVNHTFFRS